jgi:hypothetical protein
MGQTNKPTLGQIAAAGIGAAVTFAVARYFRTEGGATGESIATFLATIGWLAAIGSVVLMFLWAAKSVRP